jgi:Ca-activated chloride channel family protein
MLRRIAATLFVLIAFASRAQTLDEVKSGTLLIKTSGFYVVAPTVDTNVNLRVHGMIARGEVIQRFRNPESTCTEAVYVFPLPDDAAVDRLLMKVGDRIIEGDIQERKQAEKTYQQAKSEGRKATLLSQERPNIFTAAIANIGAGEEVTVTIEYQQTVEYRDGVFNLRFPMTIGPRYIPMSVADGNRISPPVLLPDDTRQNKVNLTVDVDAGFDVRTIDSAYHKITKSVVSGSHYVVTLNDVVADHDFELRWQSDLGSEPKSATFVQNGYALVMVMPPAVTRGARMPKEAIFIIDTSGSMGGPSIDEAKAALQLAIDRLDSGDTFNIIEFNSVTHQLFNSAQPVTSASIAQAKEWVARLNADGGTEILPALQIALDDPTPNDKVRQIVFMTDGQAGNENECFDLIKSKLGRSRLFTVGIGSAPNSHFMRDAARFGRGTFTYIADTHEVMEKMTALFEKLESPVMTNVELRFDDPTAEMWPQRVPDLYAGEPLVVAVKFGNMKGRVIASGSRGTEQWNSVQQISSNDADLGIGKLWARRKIESLTDAQEIAKLAIEHHIVSQYTSLVAVDKSASAELKNCETREVPVNLAKGWGGIDGSLPAGATPAPLLLLLGLLLLSLGVAVRSMS